MKYLFCSIAAAALFACGGNKSGEATKEKSAMKGGDMFQSVDTAGVKDEAGLLVEYKKYLELKQKNKEVLQEEPGAAIADLSYTAFFISKSASFMNIENDNYNRMKKSMDSLDAVYNK